MAVMVVFGCSSSSSTRGAVGAVEQRQQQSNKSSRSAEAEQQSNSNRLTADRGSYGREVQPRVEAAVKYY